MDVPGDDMRCASAAFERFEIERARAAGFVPSCTITILSIPRLRAELYVNWTAR
jgi:hypothetical protein